MNATIQQLRDCVSEGIAKQPRLASHIERAAVIVLLRDIRRDGDAWVVESEDGLRMYCIEGDACECSDYRKRRSPSGRGLGTKPFGKLRPPLPFGFDGVGGLARPETQQLDQVGLGAPAPVLPAPDGVVGHAELPSEGLHREPQALAQGADLFCGVATVSSVHGTSVQLPSIAIARGTILIPTDSSTAGSPKSRTTSGYGLPCYATKDDARRDERIAGDPHRDHEYLLFSPPCAPRH